MKRKKRPSVKFKFDQRLLLDGGEGKKSSSDMSISSEDEYELPSSVMYDKKGTLGTTSDYAAGNKTTDTASAANRNASGARVRAEDIRLQGMPQDVQRIKEIEEAAKGTPSETRKVVGGILGLDTTAEDGSMPSKLLTNEVMASATVRHASGARVRANDNRLQGIPQDVHHVKKVAKRPPSETREVVGAGPRAGCNRKGRWHASQIYHKWHYQRGT